jgi:hypothetical protein
MNEIFMVALICLVGPEPVEVAGHLGLAYEAECMAIILTHSQPQIASRQT